MMVDDISDVGRFARRVKAKSADRPVKPKSAVDIIQADHQPLSLRLSFIVISALTAAGRRVKNHLAIFGAGSNSRPFIPGMHQSSRMTSACPPEARWASV
jgi:hypothetical protein